MVLDLTTVERVRRLQDATDPTQSGDNMATMVSQAITAVSQAIQDFLGLPLLQASVTEVHSFSDQFQSTVWLDNYFGAMPAPTISSVKLRSIWTTDWADITAADSSLYGLSSARPGMLLYDGTFYKGEDTLQVVLASCGFSDTTANFITAFPAITDAAERQVLHEIQRRKQPEAGSVSIQGSSAMRQDPVRLLPSVLERIQSYRRIGI